MKYFLLFLLITVTVQWSVAPPVNQKSKNHDNENEVEDVEEMVSLIYDKDNRFINTITFITKVFLRR